MSSQTLPESTGRCWSRAARVPASRLSKALFPLRSAPSAACLTPSSRSATELDPAPRQASAGQVHQRPYLPWSLAKTSPNRSRAGGRQHPGHSPQGELTPLGLAPKYQRFRVVGIFHSGFTSTTRRWRHGLTDAQQLFSEPDLLSVISFKVDDLTTLRRLPAPLNRPQARLHDHQLDGGEPRALPRPQAGTGSHFIVIALIVIVARSTFSSRSP